ncbi:MAG: hypothetical protein EOM64_07330, partial [Erysipelotrichia bacterium]|nr:hypothetical protein [Erysipelotrichia bacterium]
MILHKITEINSGGSAASDPGKKFNRLVVITILSLLTAVIAVSVMFSGLISSYRSNTAKESAAHLTEISQELELYVETKISECWISARSIADSIRLANIDNDDMLKFLANQRDIYGMSDITLFTKSGYAVNADGSVLSNFIASEMVADITNSGESLSIKESTIVYTVAVDTDEQYNGSEIVTVSVERNLSSFLDSMGISSFGGAGLVYLTNNGGAVISKLTHSDSVNVYNLFAMLKESVIKPLSDSMNSADDLLTCEDCGVFLRKTATGDEYVVTSPIQTGYDDMRLFYIVPVSVVNQTTDSFSRYILTLSTIIILAFVVAAISIFLYLYKSRQKRFDKDISLREHMLELLVQNSNSAFALFEINQKKPRFYSGNAEKIIGEAYLNLEKTSNGYFMSGSSGKESDALKEINSQIKNWDGNCEFRSSFVRNSAAATPVYFEIQIFPVENSDEKGVFVGIVQDVTPLFERQVAATEALAMAEQANRAKTHFLSSMSHDIRTPMNAIVNMTNFAIESIGEPEKQREYLNTLRASSAHLLQLINDVLDMSRIESGHLTVAASPFDLHSELERIADIVRPLCVEKEQSFTADFSELQSCAVIGDQVKLSQILMNLLSNANKFTPKGGAVRFAAKTLPALRKNTASIYFQVKDSGIGISAENQKKIFEPFSRVDNSQVNKTEGTGLGLSICRSYIMAMGGTIRCESEEGHGSTFAVELFFPLAESAANTPAAYSVADETPFANRRCLICEDNEINLTIAVKLLKRLGFTIETAENGKEGSEKFIASSSGYYDVIYMD